MLSEIFSVEGRLNRLRYFKYTMILFLISVAIRIVIGFSTEDFETAFDLTQTKILTFIMGVAQIMFAIRRLHDLNRSAWFLLITLIPVVNIFFPLYLFFAKGTVGSNRFGADPLQS